MVQRLTRLNLEAFVRFKSDELVREVFNNFGATISSAIAEEVEDIIDKSDTANSLRGGQLRAEFGLTDSGTKVQGLVKDIGAVVRNELEIARTSGNSGVAGTGRFSIARFKGLRTKAFIRGVPLDFRGLTTRPWAIQDNINARTNTVGNRTRSTAATQLPWMEWLIEGGRSRNIVKGFAFTPSRIGRSGLPGVMIPARRGWRVPIRFAGSKTNNFITREIRANTRRISTVLRNELTNAIRATRRRRR